MKILFLAGCIEPGRSGVGDYTRLLAASCVKFGNTCAIVAVNDPYVTEVRRETLYVEGGLIELLRCNGRLGYEGSAKAIGAMINSINPCWVSVQFVPYAFERRGFIWPHLKPLVDLLRSFQVHIMFHELWIGEYREAPLKEIVVGAVQRAMIKWLMKRVSALSVHTSTLLYQSILQRADISAKVLPMFGTVQAGMINADVWLFPLFQTHGIPVTRESRADYWLMGLFGSIHPGFSFDETLFELRQAAAERKQTVLLLSIGDAGPGSKLWNEMEQKHGSHIHFVSLGRQSEERVSHVFNSMDLGLSSTPLDIIGKSSSVAAMLEHGLPVLVMDDGSSDSPAHESLPVGIFSRRQFFPGKVYLSPFPRRRRVGVDDTARRFLSSLDGIQPPSQAILSHAATFATQ